MSDPPPWQPPPKPAPGAPPSPVQPFPLATDLPSAPHAPAVGMPTAVMPAVGAEPGSTPELPTSQPLAPAALPGRASSPMARTLVLEPAPVAPAHDAASNLERGAPLRISERVAARISERVTLPPSPAEALVAAARAQVAADLPPLTHLARGLGLLAASGASLGLFGWSLRMASDRATPYAAANDIAKNARMFALGNMFVAAALAITLGLVIWFFRRRQQGALLVDRLGRRAAPLMVVGWLPWLCNWRLWAGHDLTMLALIAFFGISLQGLARMSFATAPALPAILPRRLAQAPAAVVASFARLFGAAARARWLPLALVLWGVAAYAGFFAFHLLRTHYRLGTTIELALEDNLVWNAAHGNGLFRTTLFGPEAAHTGYHQTYFAYVLAPLYRLLPRPQTLLVAQAILVALAAVPLFFLARRRLGAWAGCMLALAYLCYPAVHGSSLYDFHYQPLAVVFLFAILYLLEEKRDVLAAVAILLAFSVREDVSALVAVLGLYLVLTGTRPRAGMVVALAGGLCFAIFKLGVMPRFFGAQALTDESLLHPGAERAAGTWKALVADPYRTLTLLLDREQLAYVLELLVPLAFLPLRRPIGLLCCLPGIVIALLATQHQPFIQVSFHYAAYCTPFLFIAAIAALEWMGKRERAGLIAPASRHAWMVALGATVLVSTFQYGAILQPHNVRGGFGAYVFTDFDHLRHKNAHALLARIPAAAKVAASDLVLPQVSQRPGAYSLRFGVHDAEILFFEVGARGEERRLAGDALRDGSFGVVEVRGEFVLAKRGEPTARNAEVLARVGS